jgi:hypothetical protein
MPNYDQATPEIISLINETINKYHPELVEAQVTIEAVMAFDDKGGYPVKANGYPALACIRINSLKNRVKGFADAEITIDKNAYDALNNPQKIALLDHELYHLLVVRDKEGNIKTDDANRSKLRLKKHDYQMGWFKEIAARHGENSPEVYQANILWQKDGRTFFPKI